MSTNTLTVMLKFVQPVRPCSTTSELFERGAYFFFIPTLSREHCAACHHFMTSCKRCMMAYRKQREGRTRTNYISGGPNPFVRQLEENGDVDDEESGL